MFAKERKWSMEQHRLRDERERCAGRSAALAALGDGNMANEAALFCPRVSASQVLGERSGFPERCGVGPGLPVTRHLVVVAGVRDHMRR